MIVMYELRFLAAGGDLLIAMDCFRCNIQRRFGDSHADHDFGAGLIPGATKERSALIASIHPLVECAAACSPRQSHGLIAVKNVNLARK